MKDTVTDIKRPLCVDLDGSLLATDMLWETLLKLLRTKPWYVFYLPFWVLKGKALFKRQIARLVEINPNCLPFREDIVSYVNQEKATGRQIILTTASDALVADKIAQHLNLFSAVLASDGETNLSGTKKLHALTDHVGSTDFDYIGNGGVDLPIWKATGSAFVVAPSQKLMKQARQVSTNIKTFSDAGKNSFVVFFKALRVHQWVKNILIFVPLLLAHKVTSLQLWLQGLLAFCAFSLCASSIYIINDLMDLESDRQHPKKRNRPFAAGTLPIQTGLFFVPFLLGLSFLISVSFLPILFTAALGLYVGLTSAYSFYLKRVVIVDVLILAGLYTFRILSGGVALNIDITTWLLAFSMFFFLSLAFVKRYSELRLIQNLEQNHNKGRGYSMVDKEVLRSVGPASGYLSVLVLALYINSEEVVKLYKSPATLWLIGPFLLYWITRVWFLAHRGVMDDDPIVFTVRDPKSYFVGAIILVILIIASKFPIF
ncbi:UbiA family prenyltransferase [candidate division KSB1 bacterium]|nr:UbiA family prenyltransferase [candidate division KSB1 bacterium]NIR68373.1 UbiA family prenyltransferase [candidate division KSB1 bacterium]NIS25317.1 UbiA family prenyltransferase [candidate division KSB1 bacterium]NIT72228.1 UbiA family prenyltransferase [candidate division KSB1 bacterium]NIU26036.1 UbiA family prenyltransferase [candidate division KSB1 bacterium]